MCSPSIEVDSSWLPVRNAPVLRDMVLVVVCIMPLVTDIYPVVVVMDSFVMSPVGVILVIPLVALICIERGL